MKLSEAIIKYKQIKVCAAISPNRLEEINFFNEVAKYTKVTNYS